MNWSLRMLEKQHLIGTDETFCSINFHDIRFWKNFWSCQFRTPLYWQLIGHCGIVPMRPLQRWNRTVQIELTAYHTINSYHELRSRSWNNYSLQFNFVFSEQTDASQCHFFNKTSTNIFVVNIHFEIGSVFIYLVLIVNCNRFLRRLVNNESRHLNFIILMFKKNLLLMERRRRKLSSKHSIFSIRNISNIIVFILKMKLL